MRPVWNFYLTEAQSVEMIVFEANGALNAKELDILKCRCLYQCVASNVRELDRVNFQLSIAMSLAVFQIFFWII